VLVQHPESVAIVAFDRDGLIVVRQRRAGASDVTTELPSGKLEVDEAPDAAVRRELAEECGLAAERWRRIGAFWAVPAYSTELVHVYEAAELAPVVEALVPDSDEDIELDRIPAERALDELSDAVSIAALALWQGRRS
jgi:ADP-ribose pyrophosphatase